MSNEKKDKVSNKDQSENSIKIKKKSKVFKKDQLAKNLKIITKPHSHLQTKTGTSAKFQKNQHKILEGVFLQATHNL